MTNASWPRKSPIPYMVSGAESDCSPRCINERRGQISIRKDLITPQEVYRIVILLVQGLTNCGLRVKSSPLPVFVNNSGRQSDSIIYCCICLLCAGGRDALLQQRPHGKAKNMCTAYLYRWNLLSPVLILPQSDLWQVTRLILLWEKEKTWAFKNIPQYRTWVDTNTNIWRVFTPLEWGNMVNNGILAQVRLSVGWLGLQIQSGGRFSAPEDTVLKWMVGRIFILCPWPAV